MTDPALIAQRLVDQLVSERNEARDETRRVEWENGTLRDRLAAWEPLVAETCRLIIGIDNASLSDMNQRFRRLYSVVRGLALRQFPASDTPAGRHDLAVQLLDEGLGGYPWRR